MDDNIKLKLEVERAVGDEYARAYESLVKPFIDRKRAELFEVFTEIPSSDIDGLIAIKLQSNALQSLNDEFRHYIQTGQMARQSLTEKEESNG
jgi:hypothetical protein